MKEKVLQQKKKNKPKNSLPLIKSLLTFLGNFIKY
jgi:hypothetical protein